MVIKLIQKIGLIGLGVTIAMMNASIAQAMSGGAGIGYSLSQDVSYCSGYLTAEDSNSRINLREGPGKDYAIAHYGMSGDMVDFLNEAGNPQVLMVADNEDGTRWYQVGFRESGAYGWVRGNFVRQHECR
jgi:uncharacterized protein YgiM (DUF1202 family)